MKYLEIFSKIKICRLWGLMDISWGSNKDISWGCIYLTNLNQNRQIYQIQRKRVPIGIPKRVKKKPF